MTLLRAIRLSLTRSFSRTVLTVISVRDFTSFSRLLYMRLKGIAIVVVMLILASCSPDVGRRMNEEMAVEKMKAIRTAEETYKATRGAGKYGLLKDLKDAGLLKGPLADGKDFGYQFDIRVKEGRYEAIAVPVKYGADGTGFMSYYVDESGIIHGGVKKGAEANKDDPEIGGKSD